MATAKEEVRRLLEDLPDDSSLEDIQYHLYVHNKIDQGLNDAEEDNVVSQEEVKKRMDKWIKK